jgi:heavy metal sensor kinase
MRFGWGDIRRVWLDFRRFSRGLRFWLTASYAILFAVLLTGVSGLLRKQLASTLESQAEDGLAEDWAAVKGSFLRLERKFEPNGPFMAVWYYDKDDPDETTIVLDIKKVYRITDQTGRTILEHETGEPAESTIYQDLSPDPPDKIRARVAGARPNTPAKVYLFEKRSSEGEPFLIRSGVIWDEHRQTPFYLALGTSLASNEKILHHYTWIIFVCVLPGSLILGSLLGWVMAGRALTPVHEVAKAAQRISSSNLSLRIPTRQANDELDYLILTFNRMIERLEASFRQMRQFSADVSHELRTPITGIRGQLEVALLTARTTEQYRDAIVNALQDIDRLSQLVRTLLLLSQAESGQLVLQKSQVDLSRIAEDLAEQFQIPAEAGEIRLVTELQKGATIQADRVQVERLINNLISNALKFTPAGGNVRMEVRRVANEVELTVEDTGCGIPTEHLPHIFDRFYRVTGSGTAPAPEQGLGLGLSFVAWIVKAHGGSIDVNSTPGKGTCFKVKFPWAGLISDTMELARQAAISGKRPA